MLSRALNDTVENTMRRKRNWYFYAPINRTGRPVERFYWFYLARKSKSLVSSRVGFPLFLSVSVGFCDPIFARVCNSRFHILPLELLLNRLIYCRFRGVHGRQVQQGAVFPRWKMPDDRRRHRCLSLPARLHGRSLRNPGGPAGNRIISKGIISARTYHRVYTRECDIMRTLAGFHITLRDIISSAVRCNLAVIDKIKKPENHLLKITKKISSVYCENTRL